MKKLIWVTIVILFLCAKTTTADFITEEDMTINLGKSLPHSIVIIKSSIGHGTGFYISPHEIITDEHVIHNADNVSTVDINGRECPATVYYADSNEDLALLDTKCEGTPLKIATSVKVGQTVIMMGNPETETFFMTKGIVSSLSRYFVGFDARSIAGNSGSPLVSLNGEVLGVTRWVYNVSEKVAVATNNETLNEFIATVKMLKER
jgi:S1-C subfamily serine protease